MLYEGGIRVPAIVRYPALVEAGTVSDAPVIGMDWFVTLAKLGAGKVPSDRPIDGVDIRDTFAGKSLPDRTLFWALDSVTDLEFAVRHGQWKLLLDKRRHAKELYDLSEDPLEFFNLIESMPDVAKDMTSKANAYFSSIDGDALRPTNTSSTYE